MLRSLVKGTLERTLIWSGAAAVARRRMHECVLVLAYHNIVPDDDPPCGDLANHLRLSSFVAQMAELRSTHDVVPLSEALSAPPWSSRPRAAITFDDAYRGAVVHGIAELVLHGMPATIFVTPSFLGGKSFWWDALAEEGGGLDPVLRHRALGALRGADEAVRAWARANGRPPRDVSADYRAASVDELMRAAALPGITLGSHTWSHPNLTRLEPGELARELAMPLAWLRERLSNVLPWIAYPYGFFDAAVATASAAAGYKAALAISGGWLRHPPTDVFSIPRVNIPRGLTVRGFALRGAGLFTG